MQVFKCVECGHDFQAMGIRSRPHRFCPNCKHIHVAKHNEDKADYRRAHRPRIHNSGKAPYTVVRHDAPDGFRPGATFSKSEVVGMVASGYLGGCVLKRSNGKVYLVNGETMEEVK
jgi:DNA-directed RNA polymerase subunit RPC12/RpoP